MNVWGLIGGVLLWLSSTALVAQVFGLTTIKSQDRPQGRPRQGGFGGLFGIFAVGLLLAAANGGLPRADGAAVGFWLLWLGFVAMLAIMTRARAWYRRFRAIRLEQKAARIAPRDVAEPASVVPSAAALEPPIPAKVDRLGFDVILTYARRGAKPEQRQVTVRAIETGRDEAGRAVAVMISGYCHLRKRPRSFLVASIRAMADGATGEVIRDPGAWLLERASEPARAGLEAVG